MQINAQTVEPGFLVTGSTDFSENLAGQDTTISLRLTSEGNAQVQVAIPSNPYASLSGNTSFTFLVREGGWGISQRVTISLDDNIDNDYVDDGPREFEIIFFTGNRASDASPHYQNITTTITGTITDNEVAGFTVTPDSFGINLEGDDIPITVVLDEKPDPDTNVTITVESQNTDIVTPAGTGLLTFTSLNWDNPQSIIIETIDDNVDNFTRDFNINVSVFSSGDGYSTLASQTRVGTVVDNDGDGALPAFTIMPTTITIIEGGFSSADITMSLAAEPLTNVTIRATYDFNKLVDFSGSDQLVFTPGDWAVKKVFSLSSLPDNIVNNEEVAVTVTFSVTDDSDTAYQTLADQEIIVTVIDDEIPGFTLNPPSGSTFAVIDIGGQQTFTTRLSTQPETDVTLSISSDDIAPNAIMVEPILLTFTTADYSRNQTVTVTAVGDETAEYEIDVDIVPSSNLGYVSLPSQSLSGTITLPPPGLIVTTPSNSRILQIEELISTGEFATSMFPNSQDFSLKLTEIPPGEVTFTIDVTGADGTADVSNDIRVTPTMISFSTQNWADPQTVIIRAVDNTIDDGKRSFEIRINIEDPSTYPGYMDLTEFIYVSVFDEDLAALFVTVPADTTQGLGGPGFRSIDFNFRTQPSEPVTVTVVNRDDTVVEMKMRLRDSGITTTISGATISTTIAAADLNGDNDRTDILVIPIDHIAATGNQDYRIIFTSESADPAYNNLTKYSNGIVRDDESGGPALGSFNIINVGASSIIEGRTITLFTDITGDTTGINLIGLFNTISSTEHATINPARDNYRPSESTGARQLEIALTDNDYVSDPQEVVLTVSVLGQRQWNTLDPELVTLNIRDNEEADYTLTPSVGSALPEIAEGGPTTSFVMTLDAKPQPGVDVTATITHSGPGAVTFTPSELTYDSTNWDQPQTISVAALVDSVEDPAQDYTVEVSLSSGPGPYVALSTKRLVGTIASDSPGFTLSPPTGSTLPVLAEGGVGISQTKFTVVLNAQPESEVTMPVTSSAPQEASVSPSELIFTRNNWYEAQTITVTAVEDQIAGVTEAYDIDISVSAGPANYTSLAAQSLSGVVTDNEQAGIAVNISGGSDTFVFEEGDLAGNLMVALDEQPASDVVVSVTSSDEAIVTVSPTTLSFPTNSWSSSQQIGVTPVDDTLFDGPQEFQVTVEVTSGPDDYRNLEAITLSGIVTDNEVASFTITPTSLEPINEGATTTINIALGTAAGTNVQVEIATSDRSEATVDPNELTFSNVNATTPQAVVVTGVDDNLVDGNQNFTLTVSAPTGPGNFATLQTTLAGIVNDNDIPDITTDPTATTGLGAIVKGFTRLVAVQLAARPVEAVTLAVTSTDTSKATANPAALTFTSVNWNTPQMVGVAAIDDGTTNIGQPIQIEIAVNDGHPLYQSIETVTLSGTNRIEAAVGFELVPDGAGPDLQDIIEGENTTTFTVMLLEQPEHNVIFDVSTTSNAISLSSNSLTFEPGTWNAAQFVTVTSRADNNDVNGNANYAVTVAVNDASDNAFVNVPEQTLNGMVTDDDVAGFTLVPAGGASTLATISESGSTTFTARLNNTPLTDVTLSVTSTDSSAATVSQSMLVFTNTNWNAAQTVSVNGVADSGTVDGTQDYVISVTVVDSESDINFRDVDPQQLSGQVTDDNFVGFELTPLGGASTLAAIAEGSVETTFTVVLGSKPSRINSFSFPQARLDLSTNSSDISLSDRSLTFTDRNWNVAQTITVTSRADNNITDGNATYTITVASEHSINSPEYRSLPDQTLTGMVIDDEVTVGFSLTPLGGGSTLAAIAEGNIETTFTVVLDAQPLSNVVLNVSTTSSDINLSDPSLTFEPGTWDTAQTVTVTSRADNSDLNNDANYTVTVSVDDVASNDDFDDLPDQTLNGVVTDDEVASFTLNPPNGSSLTELAEGESTTTFTVILDIRPQNNVVFDISTTSSDINLSDPSLTFEPSAWNTAQTVTVTSRADNNNLEDDANYIVTVRVNDGSSDDAFDPLLDQTLNGIVTDNDTASFTLNPADGSTLPEIVEGEITTTFTVVLDKRPQNNVVFDVSTTSGDISLSHNALTFEPSVWDTAQTVTITSRVDNDTLENDVNYMVTVRVNDSSSDDDFDGLDDQILNGIVSEDMFDGQGTLDIFSSTLPFARPIDTATTIPVDEDQTLVFFARISTPTAQVSIRVQVSDSSFVDANFAVASASSIALTKTRTVSVEQSADPILLQIHGINNDRIGDNSGTYTVTLDFIPDSVNNDASFDRVSTTLTVSLNNNDNPAEIITRDNTNTNVVTNLPHIREGGGDNFIYASLSAQPSPGKNVVITVVSPAIPDVTVARNTTKLTFTSTNYKTGRFIRLTPRADNAVRNPNVDYTLTLQLDADTTDTEFTSVSLPPKEISGKVLDNEARVRVKPTGGAPRVDEGSSVMYELSLKDKVPDNAVTITINSDRPGLLTTNPLALTFNVTNSTLTFTVTANDNDIIEADRTVDISFSISSADVDYNSVIIDKQTLTISNTDDAAVMVSQLLPTIRSEESDLSVLLVELDLEDTIAGRTDFLTSRVVLSVTTQSTIVTVENSLLTFSAEPFGESHYGDAQEVRVSSGPLEEGQQHEYTLTVAVVDGSSYWPFRALDDQTVIGIVANDTASYTLNPSDGSTLPELVEGESTTTFTVILDERPQNNVVLDISTTSSDINLSSSSLTFEPSVWNTAQTVTVTSRADNSITDGNAAYTVTVSVNAASDDAFDSLPAQMLNGMVTDDDVSGIQLNPSVNLADIPEDGGQTTFTVVLNTQPTSGNVIIDLTASDPAIAAVVPAQLTFTTADWSSPQTGTVTSLDDNTLDDKNYIITVAVDDANSSDDYDGVTNQELNGIVTNDDTAGFTLSETGLGTIAEAGGNTSFTVVLDAEPSSDVELTLTTSGKAVSLSAATLTFTSGNWNNEQAIMVTGENNDVSDGNLAFTVTVAIVDADSDDNFDGLNEELSGIVSDDDIPGLTLGRLGPSNTLPDIAENGGRADFTVKLNTQPSSDVELAVTSSSTAAMLDKATVTFTNSNWDMVQTVNITGVNDDIAVDMDYTVEVSVASGPSEYTSLNSVQISGIVTNDDVAGFTLSETGLGTISENGGSTSFTVVLDAEPSSNVVLTLTTSGKPVSLSADTLLTFTSGNWNNEQTIMVTGENNDVADGDLAFTVTVAIVDADSDDNFDGLNEELSGIVSDDDIPGFQLNPSANLADILEDGGQTTFTVVLNTQPVSDVVIDLTSSDPAIATVEPSQLAFDSSNWNTAQAGTVTAVDNDTIGDQSYMITFATDDANSSDEYDGLSSTLSGTVTNDDTAGFTLSETGLGTISENGGSTSFTVVLDAEPSSNVELALTTSGKAVSLSAATLTFTSGNWNNEQTIMVTGENNDVADGALAFTVTVAIVDADSDDNFDGLNEELSGIVSDDDVAGFTLSETGLGTISENGGSTSFTVVLDAEPSSNVVLTLTTSGKPVSLSAATLTFTSGNWSNEQTIMVTGENNDVADGDLAFTVTVAIVDADSDDNFDGLNEELSGIVSDDDIPGFQLNPSVNLADILEDGGQTTFTVVLNTQPTSGNVVIDLTASDPAIATVVPAQLTFTTADWSSPQTGTVTSLDDNTLDDKNYIITVAVDEANSSDDYDGVTNQELNGIVTNDDTAGFTLSETGLGTISEAGGSTSFTVVLDAEPSSDVVLTLTNSGKAVDLSPTTLTFDSSDWDESQTIMVSGVNNDVADGALAFTVTVAIVDADSDDNFDGLNEELSGIVSDDDDAGFTLVPTGGASTLAAIDEGGSTTTFTVVLNTQPVSDVVIDLTSSDPAIATVVPTKLTFTTADWSSPQTGTVTSLDDNTLDDKNYIITVAVDDDNSSDDYDGVTNQELSGIVTNNDTASFTLNPADSSSLPDLAEGESTTTFTVVLDKRPPTNVVFDISTTSSDINLSDSSLTFEPSAWDTAQEVTITSRVDNNDLDGNADYTITVSVSAGTPFDTLPEQTLTGRVTDDEVAGFTLVPAGSASTLAAIDESGSTTFTARLNLLPTSDVTLAITSTDPDEATVSVSELVFTATNATVAQTVSVNGVADNVVDGTQDYMINVVVASGSDASYSSVAAQQLRGQVTDDDVATFILAPAGGAATLATISESESTTFTARLNLLPLADVTLSITSTDTSEATVSESKLVFTNINGTVAQTVSVDGVADNLFDGTQDYMINVAVDSGSHDSYSSVGPQQLSGQVTNIDEAFTLVHPEHPLIIEGTSNIRVTVRENRPVIGVQGNVNASIMSHSEYTVTNSPFALRNTGTNQVTINLADNNNVDGTRVVPFVLTIISATGSSQSAQNTDLVGYTQTLSLTITDDEDAFELNPASLPTITEGSNTNLEIALASQPTSAVTLDLSSSDTAVATIDMDTLTFSSTTWAVPQTVAVTGIDNDVVSGNQQYTITVSVANTADAIYSTVGSQEVSGTITDDEVADFTLAPAGGGSTLAALAEGESTTTFTVVLDAQPLNDVVLDISTTSSDINLSDTSLTFEPSAWNTAQDVTVTSRADNNITDGNAAYTVTVAVDDDGSDDAFDGLINQTLNGMVTDDDAAGFTLAPAGAASTLAALAEGESTTTFTVVLDKQPPTSVVFDVSTTSGDISLSDSSLTFLSAAWDTAQTVTVTSRADNNDLDGNAAYIVTVSVNDGSSDDAFDPLLDQTLNGIVTDNDTASFTLNPADSSSLTDLAEGRATTTFTVVLNKRPQTNVVFDVSTTSGDISLSDSSLTFQPSTWDTAQTVTITSRVDNDELDGNADYTVTVSVNDGSSDDAFDPLLDQTLTGMVTDDDVAGFTLVPTGGATTLAAIDESGETTFTARLNRPPATNVTLAITSTDPGEATVSVSELVFTAINWNAAQTVSVNGVADNVVDGMQNYMINVVVAAGSDANYLRDAVAQQLSGQVTDDEVASFTLLPADGSALSDLTEGSSDTQTFTVVLDAQPDGNVVFDVSTGGSSDASVSPNSLTFEPGNWDTEQTVTVTPRANNGLLDGNAAYTVTVAVNDPASIDPFDSLDDQTLTGRVTDNDNAFELVQPDPAIEGTDNVILTLNYPRISVNGFVEANIRFDSDVDITNIELIRPTPGNFFLSNSGSNNITVSLVDNSDFDGTVVVPVTVSIISASSARLGHLAGYTQTLKLTITEDDDALELSPASLPTITEGTNTNLEIALASQPTSAVTLTLSSSDPAVATVDQDTLTFSNTNPQTVAITGINNDVISGDQPYTITVSVDSTTDAIYSTVGSQEVSGMITNDDLAGFTPSETALSDLAEGDNTLTFTVVLDARPLSNVVLDISTTSSDISLLPSSLTFQPSNWNTAQDVTVTSRADNNITDGNAAYTVTVSVNAASDDAFDRLPAQMLNGMVTDDEVAGFMLTPASGATLAAISESGSTTFTARLNRAPATNVTLAITSTEPGEATVSDSELVFTATNATVAQTVSVNGVADNVVDGTQDYMISVAVALGSDANYSGLPPQQLRGQVTDDEVAGFTLSPSTLNDLAEGDNTLTFTVVLDAQPLNDVVLDVSTTSSDISLSDSRLTFQPSTWNTAQDVTVTSRADNIMTDGDAAYTVTVSVNAASDDAFDSLPAQMLNGMVTDDDVPGFTLSPASGATLAAISESGSTTFTARLNLLPTSDVTLLITSTDPGEATVSDSELVFTATNATVAQMVSVNGVADGLVDGTQDYMINVAVAPRSDANYSGLPAQQLRGQVTDTDVASFTLNPPDGSALSDLAEGSSDTQTFTVVLDAQPDGNVVFDVSTGGSSDASVSPNSLTFEPGNWDTEQTVTVTPRANNDNLEDDANYMVTVSVNDGSSNDAFDLLPNQMLNGIVTDNDTAGFTLNPSDGSTLTELAEGENTTTFTVVLDKRPTSDVVFAVSTTSSDISWSPSSLTFEPDAWNTAQTVTVTSRADNNITDGDAAYIVTVSVNDGSSDDAFAPLLDQTLNGVVTDNDEAGFAIPDIINITEGDPDGEEFTIALTTQPTGNVTLSVFSSETSLATVSPDMLTFMMSNWSSTQTVAVSTPIPDDEDPGDDQPFTITISVFASADPDYVVGLEDTIAGLVVDNDGLGAEETTQVKTAISVADSFGSAQVATDLITARLQQPPVLQPAAQIGDTNLVSTAAATQPLKEPDVDPWQDDKETAWSGDFEELLPGTNFVLPLSDTTVSGAHTELWGSVGYTDVKGDPTIDEVTIDYDGQATGIHVGIGRQYTNGTNFGVSIGSTKVKIDITGTEVEKIERDLVSIHPYIGWSLSDRASAWLIAGYGDGDYILELENDKIETKASLRMLGGGLQRSGMLGTFNTAIRLEGVVTRSEIEGVADQNLASDAGSAWLLRTELEIGRTYTSQGGSLIQPFGAVSYRFDGGDLGSSGAGEISLGLRSQFDDAWLADFKARLQVTEADHERHGVQGYLKYDRSNDRRGLLFSAAHSVEYENQDDAAERTNLFASELGYGWGRAIFSQRGILDIHLRNEYGDESSSLSLGIGYTTQSLQLGMDGSADEVTAHLNYVSNY